MKTAILSILTAGALAIAPIASKPAQAADAHDILGGVIGLAILGALADDLRDDRNEARTTQTQRYKPYNQNSYSNSNRYYNGNGVRRGHNKRRHNNVLPGACLRVIEGRNRDRIVFPARCLRREGIATRNLPDRCIRRVDSRRAGTINVYGARCLADRGWRLPRIATR